MKSILDRFFIDGLSGMAHGLFATLIIGTIIQQIGNFVPGGTGDMIYLLGKVAAGLTGAGIGAGVARKLDAGHLVVVSAAVVGMIGAFASRILAGEVLVDDSLVLTGPGEPLGAFLAAYIAVEIGILISGKTKLDIILTPLVCGGTFCRTAYFQVYGMAGLSDQLGNRTAASGHGNRCLCSYGNDPDASDQLGGPGRDPQFVRACSRSRHSGLLL